MGNFAFHKTCIDEFYHPEDEGGILWSDPDIGIRWPVQELEQASPSFNQRDRSFSTLAQWCRQNGIRR